MKYLKKFENHTAYSAAESGLILPNVSLCEQENHVHYNPDPYGGHEYVEIGGLKWATMNVGANSVTDTGLFFQWGDTQGYTAEQVGSGEGQKYFGWADYKYGNGTSYPGAEGMTRYNNTDGITTLLLEDDAVAAAWGGNWRMPTDAEFQALGTAVTSAWTADYEGSGVAGLILTSNADSSKKLFFPACGGYQDSTMHNVGRYGYYWSSLRMNDQDYNIVDAWKMNFGSSYVDWRGSEYRYYGFPVRGVAD